MLLSLYASQGLKVLEFVYLCDLVCSILRQSLKKMNSKPLLAANLARSTHGGNGKTKLKWMGMVSLLV